MNVDRVSGALRWTSGRPNRQAMRAMDNDGDKKAQNLAAQHMREIGGRTTSKIFEVMILGYIA